MCFQDEPGNGNHQKHEKQGIDQGPAGGKSPNEQYRACNRENQGNAGRERERVEARRAHAQQSAAKNHKHEPEIVRNRFQLSEPVAVLPDYVSNQERHKNP